MDIRCRYVTGVWINRLRFFRNPNMLSEPDFVSKDRKNLNLKYLYPKTVIFGFEIK
jgi:hypothetical protein